MCFRTCSRSEKKTRTCFRAKKHERVSDIINDAQSGIVYRTRRVLIEITLGTGNYLFSLHKFKWTKCSKLLQKLPNSSKQM